MKEGELRWRGTRGGRQRPAKRRYWMAVAGPETRALFGGHGSWAANVDHLVLRGVCVGRNHRCWSVARIVWGEKAGCLHTSLFGG